MRLTMILINIFNIFNTLKNFIFQILKIFKTLHKIIIKYTGQIKFLRMSEIIIY